MAVANPARQRRIVEAERFRRLLVLYLLMRNLNTTLAV
jgi:hypothetical protein